MAYLLINASRIALSCSSLGLLLLHFHWPGQLLVLRSPERARARRPARIPPYNVGPRKWNTLYLVTHRLSCGGVRGTLDKEFVRAGRHRVCRGHWWWGGWCCASSSSSSPTQSTPPHPPSSIPPRGHHPPFQRSNINAPKAAGPAPLSIAKMEEVYLQECKRVTREREGLVN